MFDFEASYIELVNRINEVINNFQFEKDPLNPPTPQQQDMVRAMILLCHAEYEDYIERLARELLNAGEEQWNKLKIANKNLAALFLENSKIETSDRILTKATMAILDYKNTIKLNNGIKEKDLKKLYKPLGYKVEDFDQTFVNELDSLGCQRGKVAHTSSLSMSETLDYDNEKEKILRILKEIELFQDMLFRKKYKLHIDNQCLEGCNQNLDTDNIQSLILNLCDETGIVIFREISYEEFTSSGIREGDWVFFDRNNHIVKDIF